MKIKRKARNKMSKIHDTLKPITLEMLGTEDDPCFGKHLDPKNETCARCGDCEICAIVMQQNNHLKRAEVESKGTFKDLEEKDLKLVDKAEVKKMVRKRIRELAKLKPKGQDIQYVVDDIHSTYVMHGYTKKRILKIINLMAEKSETLSITNNKLKFHKP